MVGGKGIRTRPQYCRPRGQAIANHLIRRDANDHVSRRRVALDARNLMQETKVPEHRRAPSYCVWRKRRRQVNCKEYLR